MNILSSLDVPAILKYGLTGLTFLLALFAFRLVQRATPANKALVRGYFYFALGVAVINAVVLLFAPKAVPSRPEESFSSLDQNIERLVDGKFVPAPAVFDFNVFYGNSVAESLHQSFAALALSNGYVPHRAIRFLPAEDFYAEGVVSGATHLGNSDKRYVFLADYDELKGLDVNDALEKLGLARIKGDVVAIIFDVSKNGAADVRPGSVRGIFKAMRDIGRSEYLAAINFYPDIAEDISKEHSQESYGVSKWADLKQKYDSQFRKVSEADAFKSDFSIVDPNDWRSDGFSQSSQGVTITINPTTKFNNYGALVFLARNLAVNELKGQAVIRIRRSNQNGRIPVVALN